MKSKFPKRDAEATKERLLTVGIREFSLNGYSGSRIVRIASKAKCNIRMLYHYYGSKEGLYLASLNRVYDDIRKSEAELNFSELSPDVAIKTLIEFTFDYHLDKPEFVKIVLAENVEGGRFLRKINGISEKSAELIKTIDKVILKGQKIGIFRLNVDAFQLYISILALSFFHIANRNTLSTTYKTDLSDKTWIAARRRHVTEVIMGYLRPEEGDSRIKSEQG